LRIKQIAVVTFAVAGALVLAGCGDSDHSMNGMSGTGSPHTSSPSTSTSDFNTADVTFATDMISHHRQAVQMAQMANTRAASPVVKSLAARIEDAQGPEIATMSAWLKAWGKPVPEDMGSMDMSGSMPGMMSNEVMAKLKQSSGTAFDQMFLTMMIEHHQGAITMARGEQTKGESTDVVALAKRIEAAQTDEINAMSGMRG